MKIIKKNIQEFENDSNTETVNYIDYMEKTIANQNSTQFSEMDDILKQYISITNP